MNVKILNEKLIKVPKIKFGARQTCIISSMSKQLGKFYKGKSHQPAQKGWLLLASHYVSDP